MLVGLLQNIVFKEGQDIFDIGHMEELRALFWRDRWVQCSM